MKYILILYLFITSFMLFYFLLTPIGSVRADYLILSTLFINVVFVIPIIVHKKLGIEERKKFIKNIAFLAIVFPIIFLIFLYTFDFLGLLSHSWASSVIFFVGTTFLIIFLIIVKLVLLFLATLYIVIKYKNNYKKLIKTALWSISFNYIFPFYSIVLIVWWIFNLSDMILEILR